MNGSNRQRQLVLVAALAVAVFLGDRLILGPMTSAWKSRSARLVDLRQKVTQGRLLIDREAAIRERWKTMRADALSSEVSVAEGQLLSAFDRWSRESGVGISAIRPQWRRGLDDSMVLECRADIFGNLSRLTHFLYLIEKDRLAVKLESMELSSRDPQAEQLNMVLQISGLMLRQPGS